MGGMEMFRHEAALSERIAYLGLPVERLKLALSVLRDEDKVIWFDCNIVDFKFADFGRPPADTQHRR